MSAKTMKKAFMVSLATLSLLVGTVPLEASATYAATGDNIVPNPSFEESSMRHGTLMPDHWGKGHWGTNNAVFTYPVPGHDGGNGVRVELISRTSGDVKWYFKPVSIKPNTVYEFSDYARSNASQYITAEYERADGSKYYIDLANPVPSWKWYKNEFTFTTPSDAVKLSMFHLINEVGSLTIDEMDIHEKEGAVPAPSPEPEISPSPSMSSWPKPSPNPSASPCPTPSVVPSMSPSPTPTPPYVLPTPTPSMEPSPSPSISPSPTPTPSVSPSPSPAPSVSPNPSMSPSPTPSAEPSLSFKEGMISFTFDDNWKSARDTAVPMLDEKGYKATLYLISSALDGNYSNYMTASDALGMQAKGYEIGSHSRTHIDLATADDAKLLDEVAGSRTELANLGFGMVKSFAYPFGTYTSKIEQSVKDAGYESARTTDGGVNAKATADPYLLQRHGMQLSTTVAQAKAWIDEALQNKTWLVLVLHRVDTSGDAYSTPPQDLQEVINYVASKSMKVVTISEGIDLLKQ